MSSALAAACAALTQHGGLALEAHPQLVAPDADVAGAALGAGWHRKADHHL